MIPSNSDNNEGFFEKRCQKIFYFYCVFYILCSLGVFLVVSILTCHILYGLPMDLGFSISSPIETNSVVIALTNLNIILQVQTKGFLVADVRLNSDIV